MKARDSQIRAKSIDKTGIGGRRVWGKDTRDVSVVRCMFAWDSYRSGCCAGIDRDA